MQTWIIQITPLLSWYDYFQLTKYKIAAIDISYSKKDDQKAVAALLIFDYPSMKLLYEDFEKETA